MTTPTTVVVPSKIWKSKLVFGGTGPDYVDGTDFACEASAISLEPSTSKDGDDLKVACGETYPAPRLTTWALKGTSPQFFDDPDGFQEYSFAHAREQVHFHWVTNDSAAAKIWDGELVVVPVLWGGDVPNPDPVQWEFELVGDPIPSRLVPVP